MSEQHLVIHYQEQRLHWLGQLSQAEFALSNAKNDAERELQNTLIGLIVGNIDFCTEEISKLL